MLYDKKMKSSCFTNRTHKVAISFGTEFKDDVSFQKSLWPDKAKEEKLQNFYRFCAENNIPSEKLGILSFSLEPGSEKMRIITEPDVNLFDRTDKLGNVIITDVPDITLIGWAADDCLVGLSSADGRVRAVAHVSVISMNEQNIIATAAKAMREFGVEPESICAYVSQCVGECCFKYDPYEAVLVALKREGINNIEHAFAKSSRCTVCSRDIFGAYMHHSWGRQTCLDRDGSVVHYNGQYCLTISKL